jgi:CRP/FNR family transcriptional regulator
MNVTSDPIASQVTMPDTGALLEAIPLFHGLGNAVMERLASHATVHWLRARDTLYMEGQPLDALFVLVDGSMKVVRRVGGDREHVVRLIRPGELLAESVLLGERVAPDSAVALMESRLVAIDARQLVACLRDNTQLACNVIERLGSRIAELQAQAELLATHTAEQKVAAYLLRRYRSLPRGEAVVASSCRRTDLASLLALAPETLCRVITQFKRRGWIQSESGCIVVIDANGLERAAP